MASKTTVVPLDEPGISSSFPIGGPPGNRTPPCRLRAGCSALEPTARDCGRARTASLRQLPHVLCRSTSSRCAAVESNHASPEGHGVTARLPTTGVRRAGPTNANGPPAHLAWQPVSRLGDLAASRYVIPSWLLDA